MKNKIAALISGRGSNLESLIRNAESYNFFVCCVISNNKSAFGLNVGSKASVPNYVVDNNLDMEDQISFILKKYDINLICLAGFMKILSADFINSWQDKILNIHPSLLPSFKGLHAQKQALQAKVKISGCTVHFVNNNLDSGQIVMQGAVPVLQDDTTTTLSARILKAEHQCYPTAVSYVLHNTKIKNYLFLQD